MVEAIERFFLETVGPHLCVFFCALLPIIECRGAVPLGCFFCNLPWYETALFAVIGNLLPVPFILWLIRAVLNWMTGCKIGFLNRFANWLYAKVDKHKTGIEKRGYLGLLLFVAIPLPGTGAWTGSLIASVLKMDGKKSFVFITLGVLVATAIMTVLSYALNIII